VFEWLNGFEHKQNSKASASVAKSGLSWGSLSGYLSLFNGTWPPTVDLIIELDQILGSISTPEWQRRACWAKHFETATFPEDWPTAPIFPKAHVYGHGQFNKERQTPAVQRRIVLRMTFLWARGVKMNVTMPVATNPFHQANMCKKTAARRTA
jgi:hypothetical protein